MLIDHLSHRGPKRPVGVIVVRRVERLGEPCGFGVRYSLELGHTSESHMGGARRVQQPEQVSRQEIELYVPGENLFLLSLNLTC